MIKILFLSALFFSVTYVVESDSTSKESESKESNEVAFSNDDSVKGGSASNSVENDEFNYGTRIIGGQTATRGVLSFVVRLYIYFETSGVYSEVMCSGTVLSNKHILTAAHCLYRNGRKAVAVVAETNGPLPQNFVVFQRNEIFINEEFIYWINKNFMVNDFAVLKLSSGILTNYGTPPSLPTIEILGDISVNSIAMMAGYGKTSNSGGVSPTLQYVEVNIIQNQECEKYYGRLPFWVICTLNVNKGSCRGDSGGPLLINRNGKDYIIGVSSFGASDCEAYMPSAFAYVLPLINWISSVM